MHDARMKKQLGAYYTPDVVVQSLVRWAVRKRGDRMLDPACGDGRFLIIHKNSVGVEQDSLAAAAVHERASGSLIHQGDFFSWAAETRERFECAAGNPPFIRYQRFTGSVREAALRLCEQLGAPFTSLTSSWAPFLVATASLLKPGGRLAFVVPAEIGHAPYAIPLLRYLMDHFGLVQVVAIRKKLFPELSEDCWLLYCEGFRRRTPTIKFSVLDCFERANRPPQSGELVSLAGWALWNFRLRPFVLSRDARDAYQCIASSPKSFRLHEAAKVGIGYVTGANEFFHVKPSVAARLSIPDRYLLATIRNARCLTSTAITMENIRSWKERDTPNFLLYVPKGEEPPGCIQAYLDSADGRAARQSYKCRSRHPWYTVPDVKVPDAFLAYMCGKSPALVRNEAGCVATNSVHVVRLKGVHCIQSLQQLWRSPLSALSCEIEGHPLGGGMLKLEPGEAARVVLSNDKKACRAATRYLDEGTKIMRQWRHYGET